MSDKHMGRAKKVQKGTGGTTKPATVAAKIASRAKKAGHRGNTSLVPAKVASRMGGKKAKKSSH